MNEISKYEITAEEANSIAVNNFYLTGNDLVEKFYKVINREAEKGRYSYEIVVPISLKEIGLVIENLMANGYEILLGPYSETMMTMKISWKNKRDFSDYIGARDCTCETL